VEAEFEKGDWLFAGSAVTELPVSIVFSAEVAFRFRYQQA